MSAIATTRRSGCLAGVVPYQNRALERNRGHDVFPGPEPVRARVRRPRALGFVLGDAVGIAPRPAESAQRRDPGNAAAEIHHHEAQRAADGCVCPEAGPEAADAAMQPDFRGVRPVDEDERRARARRRLQQEQIEAFLEHAFHGADHHRQVGGHAARHHGVQRDRAHRGRRHERRHVADRFVGIARRRGQHGGEPLFGGRDDRQAVRPFLVEEILDGFFGFVHRHRFRGAIPRAGR